MRLARAPWHASLALVFVACAGKGNEAASGSGSSNVVLYTEGDGGVPGEWSEPASAGSAAVPDAMHVRVTDLNPACAPRVSHLFTIYLNDKRYPIECFTDAGVRKQAESVAVIVDQDALTKPSNGYQLIKDPKTLAGHYRVCPTENFWDKLSFGACTAFLVGRQQIATTQHCLTEDVTWDRARIIFVHAAANLSFEVGHRIAVSDVFSIAKPPTFDGTDDLAIATLDGPARRAGLDLERADDGLTTQDMLYTVGHPSGLPKMGVIASAIRDVSPDRAVAELDTFEGNSGSPVFVARTGRVAGVLLKGDCDYDPCDPGPVDDCRKPHRCGPKECTGETLARASHITHMLEGKAR